MNGAFLHDMGEKSTFFHRVKEPRFPYYCSEDMYTLCPRRIDTFRETIGTIVPIKYLPKISSVGLFRCKKNLK